MAPGTQRATPGRYQLRVAGHLDTHWATWFDDLTLTRREDGTTTLTGLVQDQSQLHGLLAKVRDLGITLIGIRVLSETEDDEEEDQ
jgi:hypothetical protein